MGETAAVQVEPFSFFLPTRVEFGRGAAKKLGELCVRESYESAFVVIDPGLHASGAADPVIASLQAAGIRVTPWLELQPNPIDLDVERAAAAMTATNHSVVIGIGGGSALDTAKGVAVLASNGGRIRDYAGNGMVPARAWPFILVPTTAGTGSEATANASITQADTNDKLAIRDPNAYANQAVLDPDLLAGLPQKAAAAAGIDALTHAVESYASNRSTEMTRFIAYEAVVKINGALERFVANRSDAIAASSMLYASFLAGIAISHTGTGDAHAVSRALGGRYGIAHGVGCGVALPPVMRFNAEAVAGRYAELAKALDVFDPGADDATNAVGAADRVDEIRANIEIPETLGLHATEADLDDLQEWVVQNAGPNPRQTSLGDARALLLRVL